MDSMVHNLPDLHVGQAPKTSLEASLPISLQGAQPDEVVAYLGQSFALVRPIGMSDAHVAEWLNIAADDLCDFPADIVAAACKESRATCDDHRRLLPMVIAHCRTALDDRRRRMAPRAVTALPPPKRPAHQLTHDQLQELPGHLRRIGIKAGYLAEDTDGTLRWVEEQA